MNGTGCATTPVANRDEAMASLRRLVGSDLRLLAERYAVTTWVDHRGDGAVRRRINKGWAGQVLERYLGLASNNLSAPDFGDWELKVVPLVRGRDGALSVKESMAITMFDADIVRTPFEQSSLVHKLTSLVVAARIYEDASESCSRLWAVEPFDLGPDLAGLVRDDYRQVQDMVRVYGLDALSGHTGHLVQPRPKGAGHGSRGRAFYARPRLIAHILGL